MRKFYLLLGIGLLQIASVFAQTTTQNEDIHLRNITHCTQYIQFLKSQEKDSILKHSFYDYETEKHRVSIWHLKIDTINATPQKTRASLSDAIPTVLIYDKCSNDKGCEYLVETKPVFCEATTRREKGKFDPNCSWVRHPDECRVISLVEVPAATIYVRREILLQRNEDGKYVEK
ncbi:MAG: hypothetical protein ACKVTZ_02135 [Bacteroidia bacterium]